MQGRLFAARESTRKIARIDGRKVARTAGKKAAHRKGGLSLQMRLLTVNEAAHCKGVAGLHALPLPSKMKMHS